MHVHPGDVISRAVSRLATQYVYTARSKPHAAQSQCETFHNRALHTRCLHAMYAVASLYYNDHMPCSGKPSTTLDEGLVRPRLSVFVDAVDKAWVYHLAG